MKAIRNILVFCGLWLHERKYEIDSLCYPLRFAYHYWLVTGDDSKLDLLNSIQK